MLPVVAVDQRSVISCLRQMALRDSYIRELEKLMIPHGFAHGSFVPSSIAEFCYKCDDFYHTNDKWGLARNDSSIGIVWSRVVGSFCGSGVASFYSFDGVPLNQSNKDQKWGYLVVSSV